MTLSKLSLRNAKRQAGDYLVYFVSIVIAAALIYAFNGLIFSKEVQNLSRNMAQIQVMIVLISIVVILIMRWLVSYTINFMFTRRSREFGTYVLIGVESRQIARMFFMENLVAGGCAFFLGVILGNLLFQVLRAIVLSMFGIPYHFSISFSMGAAGLTLAYFIFIYLSAQRKSQKCICRMNIYDLIYYDRLNEGEAIKNGRKRRWIFTASIALGIVGTFLLMTGDLLTGIVGAGCIIVFLYGFFLSFASGVPAFFDKHPAWKYQRQNLLMFRTLTAKLATMGIIMATIAMLFVATIISEGAGMVFQGIFTGRAKNNGCFDILISTHDTNRKVFKDTLDYIEENIPIKDSRQYCVYMAETDTVTDYIEEHTTYYHYYKYDSMMRESDYLALRSMLGYPLVTLDEGQYFIHCKPYVAEALKDWEKTITLKGERLKPGGIYTETFAQNPYDRNGQGFILVVPDEAVKGCLVSHTIQVFQTAEPVSEAHYQELEAIEDKGGWYEDMIVYVKAKEEAEVAYMTSMTIFPLYYLALVLTMTAATILTIQQLSETNRYQRQFRLLQKLGMERREMEKTLRTQFSIYYAMPAIPPVLIGIPFIFNMARSVEPGTMVGASHPVAIIGLSLGLFFLIYGIYILMAYTSLKRKVL